MISGVSHVTLAVKNVNASKEFYQTFSLESEIIHFEKNKECHLLFGDLWLALIQTSEVSPSGDYSHVAFKIKDELLSLMIEKLNNLGATTWQENSTYGNSHYFLDPDGHKLELHSSDWRERFNLSPVTIVAPIDEFLSAFEGRMFSSSNFEVRHAKEDDFERICKIEVSVHQAFS